MEGILIMEKLTIRKDMHKIYTLYLEKVDKLTDKEREIFISYFNSLRPMVVQGVSENNYMLEV